MASADLRVETVENGVPMVRATRWGISAAIDSYGSTIAFVDHLTTNQRNMTAHVPAAAGVHTVYAHVGDRFAWLCVAGIVAAVAWALIATNH